MVARTTRRLPGFRFEAQAPQITEALPRMDVAVFIGFAASGPLDTPVPVEDAAQFAAIFGEDAPLAWDKQRGEQLFAYLAPAVRAFFQNGGRRCWVVRVAGEQARSNYFPIPTLAMAGFDASGKLERITPAFAQARSEGSWSDSLQVSAALLSRPLEVLRLDQRGSVIELVAGAPDEVTEGDLLRLTFAEQGYVLMLTVESVEAFSASPPVNGAALRVSGSRPLWFKTGLFASPPQSGTRATATVFTRENQSQASRSFPVDFESAPIAALINWPETFDGALTIDLNLSLAEAPAPGSLVRVTVGTDELWLCAQDLGVTGEVGSPPGLGVRVSGRGLWLMRDAPVNLPVSVSAVEKLTFELWVKQRGEYLNLSDLGFASPQARFWGELPTDQELYQDLEGIFTKGRAEIAFERERQEIWRTAGNRRFPLAGDHSKTVIFFPVSMPAVPEAYLGPVKLKGDELHRDGLANFDASLFLDTDLVEVETTAFMGEADFLRYLSLSPRRLRGIHAALGFGESTIIEEATIIAVPDAVHRGWVLPEKLPPLVAEVSSPPARPEWWHFLDCNPQAAIPLVSEPERGYFLDCDIEVLPTPVLFMSREPDHTGTFALLWTSPLSGLRVKFVLEESTRANFAGAVKIYEGAERQVMIYGRSEGEYFYRVRAEVKGRPSDWSNGVGVRVPPASLYQLKPVEHYSADVLTAVHRALLRMCGARGDLLAVLALPEHYREGDALRHVSLLKSTESEPVQVGRRWIAPLGFGETNDFSYAALYHPWLIASPSDQPEALRRMPPDGANCGVLADRAIARGAWIAPANKALRGVVALAPRLSRERRLDLQEAQINQIQQEPRGFLALSADTLSTDIDLRPIGVRRLMILLRRLAFRLGARYVFEPNDESFRRTVKRGFDAMLGEMFDLGAFAGATPATSFQVVTSSSLNTPQSVDQGRFIVELRVAPSLPMTFLTIRLVQTGERAFVTEGL
jgi:hypothetical protein